ncbi:MAG: cation:proton antiporter [Cyanobacteria bacterium]|nr:cation:proton antiporter [Cyanobacteriota bacterium]
MEAAHHDPVVPVLLGLSVVLIAAKIGAIIAEKLKQPEVLGELTAGILVGNIVLFNYSGLEFIKHDQHIAIFAELGVIILLFDVGLEANVKEMLAVGFKSLLVAIAGVITPFLIGYYITGMIVPDISNISKIFMGAILTATSVGITARVFKDLDFMKQEAARIVLGAAVIDDILGLIILAIVTGMAQSGQIEIDSIVSISVKAIGFVVISLILGIMLAQRTIKLMSVFKIPGMMLTTALVLCFMGAYLANQAGLATIVGAFAIGLVLEEVHFKSFLTEYSIHDYIRPLSYLFVPIFFVITGMQVDLAVFAKPSTVIAALAITAVAIIGKLICGWAFTSSSPINRMIIGIGMVPRGEVGLIFATVGKSIGVINDELYAITVIMVILTTLIPPPILNYLIQKQK